MKSFLASKLFYLLAGSLFFIVNLSAAQPQPLANADSIREGARQIQQGTGNTAASDAIANARQGMAASNLALQKAIQNSKVSAFVALFNSPIVGTQFEQFLNAPAETSEAAKTYRNNISKIMELLTPPASKANQDAAFALLTKASEFESDANLCTTIHDAVYAAANSRVEIQRLMELNQALEKQRKVAEWNNLLASRDQPLSAPPAGKNDVANNNANQQMERQARMDPTKRELASVGQTIEHNKMQLATTEAQSKFQFQALILQLFAQRRYQHVIIANRFYRALFDDGDQSLEKFQQMADKMGYNKQAGQVKLIAEGNPNIAGAVGGGGSRGTGASSGTNGGGASTGDGGGEGSALALSGLHLGVQNMSAESLMNAVSSVMKTASRTFKSLSQLDGIANEIIRDVNEGVKSYKYLLAQNEIEAATGQLVTLWTKGQYLPSVQLITQDEKRKSLKFAHLLNKLISAGQSGNIEVLSSAVSEMKKEASDFDDTEILSSIQGIKLASGMHIAQARIAVSKGDLQTVQSEITRAAGVCPIYPELQSFSLDMSKMSEKASPQVKAADEFDQYYSQKNFREIFDKREKYIASIAVDDSDKQTTRKENLQAVLDRMQEIETSIMRSQEIARRGDYAGAWEGLEITFGHYPDDTKLSQMRAELTTQAPDFVHDIREAKAYEVRKEYGSALAWYLRSQSRYPMSDLSKQGIERVAKQILPDTN